MLIGELAKIVNTSIDTIRYYEKEGLIKPVTIRKSGYREFDQSSIEKLKFILNAKKLGFKLKEVKELLTLNVNPDTNCNNIHNLAQNKLQEVTTKIKTLQILEKQLTTLVKQCKSNKNSGCPIITNIGTKT